MDKNSLIGFVLIAIILIFFLPTNEVSDKKTTKIKKNSVINSNNNSSKLNDEKNDFKEDSISLVNNYSSDQLFNGSNLEKLEKNYTLENDKIKVVISNKGGQLKSVIMKDFKTYQSKELDLFIEKYSKLNLLFQSKYNSKKENHQTADYFFEVSEEYEKNKTQLKLKLKKDNESYIEFCYKLTKNSYLVDFDINSVGMNQYIPNQNMFLEWKTKTPVTEKSKRMQDQSTNIHYQIEDDVDDLDWDDNDEIKNDEPVNWIAFKQQFFSTILISKEGGFQQTKLISKKNKDLDNTNYIKDLYARITIPKKDKKNLLKSQFYFGPNNYSLLKEYDKGYEEIMDLGYVGIDSWVNKHIIIPLFSFLSKFSNNYGLIILLLTIIIKLSLAPLTYKSYLSQAKMKVLKPEIDKLNEKNKGQDPMKAQQATMNLYRRAGVNPLGGCLPMLLQFPILIAMFRFFPSSIEIRQKSFLWADDLSSFDNWIDLPVGIMPDFFGDHISLFTLLMTVSTLLYTRMNASMSTGQMAQMKWIMYLMPIIFLGIFNNYAAGLTYYYFLANMFTMTQQFVMKRFVNEDVIYAQLEANKKKPPKPKSRFQKKLEEMQRQQEKKMRNRKRR